MRRSIVISLLPTAVLFVAAAASAQTNFPDALENNPLKDKLPDQMPKNPMAAVHVFSMDGSIKDSVTGVEASVIKGIATQDGYVGDAMHFDGKNSYAEVPIDITPSVLGNMTFVAFVRSDALPEDIDSQSTVDSSGYIFTDTASYVILGNQNKDTAFYYASSAGALVSDYTQHQVKRGQWQMVAMSRKIEDRTTSEGDVAQHTVLQLYVDGRVTESVAIFDSGSLGPKMTLGDISDGSLYTFRGGLDQIAIYNRALDKEELDELRGMFIGARPLMPVAADAGENEEQGQSTSDPTSRVTRDPIRLPSDVDVQKPTPAAEDLARITGTEDGQDLLKSADWRIVGMVPNSADKPEIYPGDDVTVKIRIRKNDPANKIPEVRFVTRAGRGAPLKSQKLIVNTTDALPAVTRELPITITAPRNIEFEAIGKQVMWRPTVWLNAKDGKPLQDAIRDNHRFELALAVMRPVTSEECEQQRDSADGTRTSSQCLGRSSNSPKAPNPPGESQRYPKVDVSTLRDSAMSARVSRYGNFRERHNFSERGSVLGLVKVGERGDRPCRLAIDDASPDAFEAGQVSNHCRKESANGNKEVRIPLGWGIVALTVCRASEDNHRIKGVRVVAQRIRDDGTLSDESVTKDFERPNCGSTGWQGVSQCENGHVGAGIVSEWDTGAGFGFGRGAFSTTNYLTNLGLICAKPLPFSSGE